MYKFAHFFCYDKIIIIRSYEKYLFLISILYSHIFHNQKLWKQYLLTIISLLETMHTISNYLV